MSDFYLVEADEPDDAARKIIELVRSRIPARFGLDPIREVQVLCPMNRAGSARGPLISTFKPPSTVIKASLRWPASDAHSGAATR